jgi:hypothetical protein
MSPSKDAKKTGKTPDSETGVAPGVALDPNQAAIIAAWPSLPPAIRAAIVAMIQATTKGE